MQGLNRLKLSTNFLQEITKQRNRVLKRSPVNGIFLSAYLLSKRTKLEGEIQ